MMLESLNIMALAPYSEQAMFERAHIALALTVNLDSSITN